MKLDKCQWMDAALPITRLDELCKERIISISLSSGCSSRLPLPQDVLDETPQSLLMILVGYKGM